MKIYFTSSITGLSKYRKHCELISKILKDAGHKVDDVFLHISKEEDRKETQTDSKHVYDYVIDHIRAADIFIAEMSYRSAPVSYQLTYALDHNKPSLYLVEKGKGSMPHAIFQGNPSKYLAIKEYTLDSVEHILRDYLKYSKGLLMRRFNFLLPAELDEYLGIKAAMERTSKGEYLRGLIEQKIKEDEQFSKLRDKL
jgi:hypothetical protein